MIRETARNSSPDRSENPRNEGRAKRSPKVGIVTESRIGFGSSEKLVAPYSFRNSSRYITFS